MNFSFLKSTKLIKYPSFFKGASRVVDIYGKLDKFNEQTDSSSLSNDWNNVGKSIYSSIKQHEQK